MRLYVLAYSLGIKITKLTVVTIYNMPGQIAQAYYKYVCSL